VAYPAWVISRLSAVPNQASLSQEHACLGVLRLWALEIDSMTENRRAMRKKARLRRQRIRAAAFAAITLAVLGTAGSLLWGAFNRQKPPPMAGNVVDVAADMAGFDQPEIRVKLGQPVTVRLSSLDNSHPTDGGGKHQWAVDELGVDIVAPPLGSSYATFTPQQAGSYTFYCDICCGGRANPSMNGTLIVEA
jgi:heme/copper-type cytochrome/quinol oxidase subunit 2